MAPIILIFLFALCAYTGFCITHSLAWHGYWVRRARKQESYLWSKAV